MNKKRKLYAWYFLIVIAVTLLTVLVFVVMNNIEKNTSYLEQHIAERNLSYIVDQDYTLKKEKKKDESVHFLNDLTDFFYLFHEKTVDFKKRVDAFAIKKKHILHRFNNSKINIFDMSVVPNDDIAYVELKEKKEEVDEEQDEKFSNFTRQLPFTRQLKFGKKDLGRMTDNMFFMCTARVSITVTENTALNLAFVGSNEDIENENLFMEYYIYKKTMNININKIIHIEKQKNFRIAVKGYADNPVKINKVDAYCMNFNDVTDQEVSKIK